VTRPHTSRLFLAILVGSALASFATAWAQAAEEEEPMQPRTVSLTTLSSFATSVRESLSAEERRSYPSVNEISRVGLEKNYERPRGEQVAVKVERSVALPAPTVYALADQALHGFLIDALVAAGQTRTATRIRALPTIRDATTARDAIRRLTQLSATAGAAAPTVQATLQVVRATFGHDAARATTTALVEVVKTSLSAGADRRGILSRAAAIGSGRLPPAAQ